MAVGWKRAKGKSGGFELCFTVRVFSFAREMKGKYVLSNYLGPVSLRKKFLP